MSMVPRSESCNRSFIVPPIACASTPCLPAISRTASGCAVEIRIREGLRETAATSGRDREWNVTLPPIPPSAAFGQRHGEPSVAEIVRGFRQARGYDLAHHVLHALFIIHVEGGRQAPQLLQDHFGVLRTAEAGLVALRPGRPAGRSRAPVVFK